jgi:hypothetical protein
MKNPSEWLRSGVRRTLGKRPRSGGEAAHWMGALSRLQRCLILGWCLVGCLPTPPADDAPEGDAQPGGDSGCQPQAESCDGQDNDCDGQVDETFDLTSAENCGQCGNDCTALPNTNFAACVEGACRVQVGGCAERYQDCDQDGNNGCEGYCLGSEEPPTCNGLDDDCDCATDEGTGLESDVNNCGTCELVCPPPQDAADKATIACVEETCVIDECVAGWFNPDGRYASGCRCRLPDESREVERVRPGPGQPEGRRVAFAGDGTTGRVVWVDAQAVGDQNRLILNVRPMDAEGYWLGPAEQPWAEEGPDLRLDNFLEVAPGRFGVVFRSGDVLTARLLDEASARTVADDCSSQDCYLEGIDGEVVGLNWRQEGEAPTITQRLVTSTGQELARRVVEEPTGFDQIVGFACRARDECAALFNRGGALRVGVNGNDVELEGNQIAAHQRALEYGAEGLVAIWRRQRDEVEETVAAVIGDAGQVVRGPAVLDLPSQLRRLVLIPDGPAGFLLFFEREEGEVRMMPLRSDGSAAGEVVAFGFYPRQARAADVLFDDEGRLARRDRLLSRGLPWPRPLAGYVPTTPSAADAVGTPPGPVAWLGQEAVFLEAPEGLDEPMLFTMPDGPEPTAVVPWSQGAVAVAVGTQALRVAWVAEGQPPRRSVHAWQAPGGESTRLEEAEVALVGWGDDVLVAITGRVDAASVLGVYLLAGPDNAEPLVLTPLGARESAPRLVRSGADGGVLLTAVANDQIFERRLRALDASGVPGQVLAELGRTDYAEHHAMAQATDTFVVWLDGAMGNPACADSVRFLRCTRGGCEQEAPGLEGAPGRPGTGALLLPPLDGACYTRVAAAPGPDGGLLVVATAQNQSRLWLMSFDAELRLLGGPNVWPLANTPTHLDLVPGENGAHVLYWRGILASAWLGCTP